MGKTTKKQHITQKKHTKKATTKKKTTTAHTNKKYTYLIKSNTFDAELVKKEFESRGNWQAGTLENQPIDFLFVDGKFVDDRELYNVKSNLKSLMGDAKKQITDKDKLYKNLMRMPGAARFLPKTYPFNIRGTNIGYLSRFRNNFRKGMPMICKVVKGGAGMGIITTDNYDEFIKFMRPYYSRMAANPAVFKQYEWVLQEYITNPWLINGKKMHLRQLMIFQPGNRPCYYMKEGEFALAAKDYNLAYWTDKAMHDTHFHHGVGHNWPNDTNLSAAELAHVEEQFNLIYTIIVNVMRGLDDTQKANLCYSDSRNCFEILGMDFMLTNDLQVKLIEVNDKVGMSPDKEFTGKLFRGMMKYVIDDYYKPAKAQAELTDVHFIKISETLPKHFGKESSNTGKYTYLIRAENIDIGLIKSEFEKRGNWCPGSIDKQPIDFIFLNSINLDDATLYNVKCGLKSIMNNLKRQITYKDNLYKNLSLIAASKIFLPKTVPFDIKGTRITFLDKFKKYFKTEKPIMCKLVRGGAGIGIINTDKFDDFVKHMEPYYKSMHADPANFKRSEWVLQEYINNPFLINGKKTHIRQMLIIRPNGKPCFYINMGKIALAEKKYISDEWHDKDIHDTHFHDKIALSWPDDAGLTQAQIKKVNKQLDTMYAIIVNAFRKIERDNGTLCNSESSNCFDVLGVDIMLTSDLKVKLLELNGRPGYSQDRKLTGIIFKAIMKYIVDDFFVPQNQMPDVDGITFINEIPGSVF